MAIQKSEYELSVWNEELNSKGIKEESKGVIIGAHDMTHLGRATALKLVRSIKGTNMLSFQMPTKYFDSEKGDFVKNELIEDLYNERKLKLYFDGNWYEFYIKKITENKQYKAIMKQFECTDSFIDELSRTGYEVEFAPELNNSVEEIGVFMETEEDQKIKGSSKAILDGSVWDYRPDMNTGDFTEYKEMRFYKIPLSQFGGSITGYPINLEVKASDFKNSIEGKTKDERATMVNPFTYEKRPLEYGDDQARVEELFWDPYETDNGSSLIDSKKQITLTGDYIYVPITDLSFIMGGVYENASKSLEEPALYGAYKDNAKQFALQPTSSNPEDFIQFIFFNNEDEVLIDEGGVVANNDCHYLIKISEWNSILKKQLSNKTNGLIHWVSPVQEDSDNYILIKKYETNNKTINGENIKYTVNVYPTSRTIDDFQWYPVYYEGYLDNIGKTEVSMARKISITDRTELNLNDDIYVTVYNNKANEYTNLYSDDTVAASKSTINQFNKYRVTSKMNTRQILPILARNLIENGEKITDTNGWEAKTQNINHEFFDTGSYRRMLSLSVQSTVNVTTENGSQQELITADNIQGKTADEGVSDYYLEILSPYIEKGDDFSKEGEVLTDYALNFGLIGQEEKIEKDKVYAIRLLTGQWITDNYYFRIRNYNEDSNEFFGTGENSYYTYTEDDKEKYTSTINEYLQKINDITNDANYKNLTNFDWEHEWPTMSDSDKKTAEENICASLQALLVGGDFWTIKKENNSYTWTNKSINGLNKTNNDKTGRDSYLNWKYLIIPAVIKKEDSLSTKIQAYNNSDVLLLKNQFLRDTSLIGSKENETSRISDFFYNANLSIEIEDYITENRHFEKRLNVDLDKVVIGSGATNLQGNYVVAGTEDNSSNGNFISFKQLAEKQEIVFIPNSSINNYENNSTTNLGKTGSYKFLTSPLYNIRDLNRSFNKRWSWSTVKPTNMEDAVEDNAFLLFKAKKTIENPYVAIRVDSGPLEIVFDNIEENLYIDNNGTGVKICTAAVTEDLSSSGYTRDSYDYMQNRKVEIYLLSKDNFSEDFLKSVQDENGNMKLPDSKDYGKLKDGSFKESARSPWSSITAFNKPTYFSTIRAETESSTKTYGYALFIDGKYCGVFWLEKKNGGDQK